MPTYTECDYLTKQRSLIYFYSTNTECQGNLPLPPAVRNIPCGTLERARA